MSFTTSLRGFLVLFALCLPAFASAQTPPISCKLTPTQATITLGANFVLKWTSTSTTQGTITGVGSVPPAGSIALAPTASRTFLGTFFGPLGTTTCSASLTVTIPTPGDTTSGGSGGSSGSSTATNIGGSSNSQTQTQTQTKTPSASQASAGGQGLLNSCTGTDCQACDVLKLIQRIINYLLGLSIPIVMALFAYAGILYFTSATNTENVGKAKKIFKSALIGFVISLTSFIVVDTVLHLILAPTFLRGVSGQGWNVIECVPQSARPTDKSIGEIFKQAFKASYSGTNAKGAAGTVGTGGTQVVGNGSTGTGGLSYQSGIADQIGQASGDLTSLISCIGSKVSGQVSSISDSTIISGAHTFAYCAANGQAGGCAHGANSCHYGGRSCVGASYAVDLVGDNAALMEAANSCGAAFVLNEGNHVHASVGSSCGCDGS